jgi:hypothetical protein
MAEYDNFVLNHRRQAQQGAFISDEIIVIHGNTSIS